MIKLPWTEIHSQEALQYGVRGDIFGHILQFEPFICLPEHCLPYVYFIII